MNNSTTAAKKLSNDFGGFTLRKNAGVMLKPNFLFPKCNGSIGYISNSRCFKQQLEAVLVQFDSNVGNSFVSDICRVFPVTPANADAIC